MKKNKKITLKVMEDRTAEREKTADNTIIEGVADNSVSEASDGLVGEKGGDVEIGDSAVDDNDSADLNAFLKEKLEKFAIPDEQRVSKKGFIQLKDITKTYTMGETEIRALDGVECSIDEGEFVIVVGASGAGKSTILNILGGMDKATSGQMIVDENDISSYNKKQMTLYRRYDVGFVFQSYNLVQNLTARENVELATQVSREPLDVDETIKAVGLEDRSGNFPSQLSGGEQQRVAIARALAKNPKMLLCDEPTGALDYSTGKSILKLLQDTARSHNMTVIIVTHNAALTSIGDKVIRVKSGKIESVSLNENPMDIADVEW